MSEVDIKAEGELEEGETIQRLQHDTLQHQATNISNEDAQIIHIETGNENDPNMVVASMLPMTSLNMEDPATYVALAQLTQAAIESAPMDESGNVILMSYADIQKSMQEIQESSQQQQQQHHDQQDIALHNIQIAQQHDSNNSPSTAALVVHQQHQQQQITTDESYTQNIVNATDSSVTNVIDNQIDLNVSTS